MPPIADLRLVKLEGGPPALPPEVRSVALIGNYPPRRCGIATFTADVRASLLDARPDLVCEVYAMNDAELSYPYPAEVAFEIRQDQAADYLKAASRLSATRPDVVCVQHEFGIFGGPAGEQLMLMLDAIDRPVVATLHTVLDQPDPDQRRVFERLLARSSRLIVMAERGRRILREVWRVADDKIVTIPHGAPDRPLAPTAPMKEVLGYAGHDLLFTFGLLSPNKGIETVIRALPRIVAARPSTLYVVLGATHPHLIAHEGERYRRSLLDLADSLGVGRHLQLLDSYTDTPRLIEFLQAADIYVTPYLNAAQVTSGTLSYAAAMGKPIVSTPYWHAEELLSGGGGRLVPFGDSEALGDEIARLLADDGYRANLSQTIYRRTRHTTWAMSAESTLKVFETAVAKSSAGAAAVRARAATRPADPITAVRRMTDGCGILQHSQFGVPDRDHGYCVDDNARALMLMLRAPGGSTADKRQLIATYASFVQHAWNGGEGRFRNFMSYERRWLEAAGSEDSTGRAALSVALCVGHGPDLGHRRWAQSLISQILPHLEGLTSPRAQAFALIALVELLKANWDRDRVTAMAGTALAGLTEMLRRRRAEGKPWFEEVLSYDNGRLPEAVIRGAEALGDSDALALGLEALDWLCVRQTGAGGEFAPVATADFGRPLDARSVFDQQPLESLATVEACEAAFAATADRRWIAEAERAFAWYEGANTLGARVATDDGECFDGLTWNGPNENRGAESLLSYQLAACARARLTALGGGDLSRLAVEI